MPLPLLNPQQLLNDFIKTCSITNTSSLSLPYPDCMITFFPESIGEAKDVVLQMHPCSEDTTLPFF